MMMLAGAAMMAVACGESNVNVDRVNVDVSEALSPERTDSVKVTVNVEYPVSGLSDSVRTSMCEIIVGAAFGSDYAGLDVSSAAAKWAADFVGEYRSTNIELLDDIKASGDMMPADGGTFSWQNTLDGYFSGRYKDIISYTVSNYVFEGGAHGSTVETSVNMSVKTGKQITEEDFFIPGYKEDLSAVLTAHLRESMPDQDSYDALFRKDIEPNGNFKVSEQGLTYVYGQYEIGPYYLGIIKVTVPWDELGDLVREHPVI